MCGCVYVQITTEARRNAIQCQVFHSFYSFCSTTPFPPPAFCHSAAALAHSRSAFSFRNVGSVAATFLCVCVTNFYTFPSERGFYLNDSIDISHRLLWLQFSIISFSAHTNTHTHTHRRRARAHTFILSAIASSACNMLYVSGFCFGLSLQYTETGAIQSAYTAHQNGNWCVCVCVWRCVNVSATFVLNATVSMIPIHFVFTLFACRFLVSVFITTENAIPIRRCLSYASWWSWSSSLCGISKSFTSLHTRTSHAPHTKKLNPKIDSENTPFRISSALCLYSVYNIDSELTHCCGGTLNMARIQFRVSKS